MLPRVARATPKSLKIGFLAPAILFAGWLTGCATHRELVVESDPPGASVRLDEKLVGTTPYTSEFEAFGTRRLTLYLEGYRPVSRPVKLAAPWYARERSVAKKS